MTRWGMVLAALLLVSGCGGGEEQEVASSPPPSSPERTTGAEYAAEEQRSAQTSSPGEPVSPVPVDKSFPPKVDVPEPEPIDEDLAALLKNAGADDVPQLSAALQHTNPQARQQAAVVLSYFPEAADTAVPELTAAVSDPDDDVRAAVAGALAEIGPAAKDAVPILVQSLERDRDQNVRENVAIALGQIGPDAAEAVPVLSAIVGDHIRATALRGYSATALGLIGGDAAQAKPALVKMLNGDDGFRTAAAVALGRLGATDELLQASRSANESVQIAAIRGLGKVRPATAEVVDGLSGTLKHEEGKVRRIAVLAFGELEPKLPEAVALLLPLMQDEDGVVKQYAEMVLQGYEPDPRVKLVSLLKAFNEAEEDKRWQERNDITKGGKEHIAAIIEILGDDEAEMGIRNAGALVLHNFRSVDRDEFKDQFTTLLRDESVPIGIRGHVAVLLRSSDVEKSELEPVLIATLESAQDMSSREKAAETLGSVGTEAAVPALIDALKLKGGPLSSIAASSLGALRDEAVTAIPALAEALNGGTLEEPGNATWALGNIGSQSGNREALQVLLQAAQTSSDQDVRGGAVYALGLFQDDAESLVPVLIEALGDEKPFVREQAIDALERFGPDSAAAVPKLLALLKEETDSIRWQAVQTLGAIGPEAAESVPALVVALSDPSSSVRRNAAVALGRIKADAETVVPALAKQLNDNDVRDSAVQALGQFESAAKPAVPGLTKILAHKTGYVRGPAIETLGRIGPGAKGAVPALKELLKTDEVPYQRFPIVRALVRIAPDDLETMRGVLAALKTEDERREFSEMMREMGEKAVPIMLAAAEDPNIDIRRSAMEMLRNMKNVKAGVSVFQQALDDEDPAIRQSAAMALNKFGIPIEARERTLPILIESLKSEARPWEVENAIASLQRRAVPLLSKTILDAETDDGVRIRAAMLLGRMGVNTRQATDKLQTALKAENESIRLAAAIALARINRESDGAVPVLVNGLKHEEAKTRRAVVEALNSLGPKSKAAVPALIERLEDEDEEVRESTGYALSSIGVEKDQLPLLVAKLENEESRRFAVDAISGMRDKAADAVPALVKLLGVGDQYARQRVGYALAAIGKPSIPELVKAIHDDNAETETRTAAIKALGSMGEHAAEAAPALKQLVENEKEETLRLQAAVSLARLRKVDASLLPLLVAELKKPRTSDSYYCLEALRELGPEAAEALPDFIEVLKTATDRQIRSNAVQALAAVAPDSSEAVTAAVEHLKTLKNAYEIRNLAEVFRQFGTTAVPQLLELLESDRPEWKIAAVRSLGAIGKDAADALPALRALLSDDDDDVAINAAIAVVRIDPKSAVGVPMLIQAITRDAEEDRENPVRDEAIRALGELGPLAKDAVPALIELADDDNLSYAALQTLGQIGPEARDAVPTLIVALGREDRFHQAAEALGEIGPDAAAAVPALTEMLGDPRAMYPAAQALGKMGEHAKPAVESLVAKLDDAAERFSAVQMLGYLGEAAKTATPQLIALIDDSDLEIRRAAIRAIGDLGEVGSEAIPRLIAALDETELRASAAFALGRIGPAAKAAVPPLLAGLKSDDSTFRTAAVSALGRIHSNATEVVPALIDLLDEEEIRYSVLSALGEFEADAAPAIPKLVELYEQQQIRATVAATLGKIGPAAKETLPMLRESLNAERRHARATIREAIEKIEGE